MINELKEEIEYFLSTFEHSYKIEYKTIKKFNQDVQW